MVGFLLFLGMMVFFFIFAALQRKQSPETLINGFMDYEKAKELAPTVFTSKKDKTSNRNKI